MLLLKVYGETAKRHAAFLISFAEALLMNGWYGMDSA